MARYDFRTPRLFVEAPLTPRAEIALDRAQTNYLLNVLRLPPGAPVLAFNGRDGEWRASLIAGNRKTVGLAVIEGVRPQPAGGDLHYLFAPLKHARLDYMVQKAVEMGASRLVPVLTRHGQVARINLERMRANAIEAAEQCGILTLPEVEPPRPLEAVIAALDPSRLLVFCDEEAPIADPVAALAPHAGPAIARASVLIGPEGGFAESERIALLARPNLVRLSLGPRILRADTAAVAVLALVQAVIGDWRAHQMPA
jgi:16S rRNA (uracil1498-N3)-methyltransferase